MSSLVRVLWPDSEGSLSRGNAAWHGEIQSLFLHRPLPSHLLQVFARLRWLEPYQSGALLFEHHSGMRQVLWSAKNSQYHLHNAVVPLSWIQPYYCMLVPHSLDAVGEVHFIVELHKSLDADHSTQVYKIAS